MRRLSGFALLLTIFSAALISGCSGGTKDYRREEGMVWNTIYHITYQSDKDLNDSIIQIFNQIDGSLSPFNPSSTISKINDNRTDTIDRHLANVYNESVRIHKESGGVFDPTLAPLIRAWGFGQGHEVSTDTLRIDSLLRIVGIDKTELQGFTLVKDDPAIEFNFSAIAKGYGVDCVAEMLQRNGVENYLVEIGGEIRAKGINSSGKPWKIGIDKPVEDSKQGDIVLAADLTDCAMATSGNYRNFHQGNGSKFGHTISPVTGRPVTSDVISATVVATTCMEADALATCCMALGSQEALALCNRLKVGVLLILSDMSTQTNTHFPKISSEF